MYAKEACDFMFVPLVTGGMAKKSQFPTAFEALLADYGLTIEQYEQAPACMDVCQPVEILHHGVPGRCCSVDFTFDWSDLDAYEQLVETYARCTLGAWSPSEVVIVDEGSGAAVEITDSSGSTRIPVQSQGEGLCQDFERRLRAHVEDQVPEHAFLFVATDPEAGIVWLHWFEDMFVPAFERRIKSLKGMAAEHRIRVRDGDRVRHKEYGSGVVVDYKAADGLNMVRFVTDDGVKKAVNLSDPALSLDQ